MNKKSIAIILVMAVVLVSGFILYKRAIPAEYVPDDDEIALYIQLDTKEDIGLLVFDYSANGSEYSGGMSNANKTLIKHDERLIEVWDKETLQCSADTAELSIRFRIITEYVDPNYENIYPGDLTKYLEKISFEARFGEVYSFTISGDNISGYRIYRTDHSRLPANR